MLIRRLAPVPVAGEQPLGHRHAAPPPGDFVLLEHSGDENCLRGRWGGVLRGVRTLVGVVVKHGTGLLLCY